MTGSPDCFSGEYMKTADIYAIAFPNGKLYIGLSTKGAEHRFRQHVNDAHNGSKFPVHRAIRKYEPFVKLIILRRRLPYCKALVMEQWYIKVFKTKRREGYNQTCGGEGSLGRKNGKRQREAVSEMNRQRWNDPESREKILAAVRANQTKAAEANRNREYTESQLVSLKKAAMKSAEVNRRRWREDTEYRKKMLIILENGRKRK